MKKAILYARVSSQHQAEKDLSIPSQFSQMRQYCKTQGWEIVGEVADEAKSGRSANRAGLMEIMEMSSQKPFDIVLVWKLSRFARNLRDAVNLEYELHKKGIELVSVSEPVGDGSRMGQSLRDILHVINQIFSVQLSEDVSRGLNENASRGYWNGNWTPLGYISIDITDEKGIPRKKLDIDPIYAPIVRRIFHLSGMGFRAIAKALNAEGLKTNYGKPFSKQRISHILRDELYLGIYKWGDLVIEHNQPPIIDRRTFEKVQVMLRTRSPKNLHPRRINSRYILSGLAECGKCGGKMVGLTTSSKKKGYYYYACSSRREKGICDAPLIRKEILEEHVLDALKEKLLNPVEIQQILTLLDSANNIQSSTEELTRKRHQIHDVEKRLENIYDALETGSIPVEIIASRLKELSMQKKNLEAEIADLKESISEHHPFSFWESNITDYIQSSFLKGETEEQRVFLRSFIKKIIISDNIIHIEFSLPLPPEILPMALTRVPDWSINKIFLDKKCFI